VGRGSFRGGFGAAGLEHDNRLRKRDLARGREKLAGIADRFHIDDDAARPGIVAQILDQVTPAHIEHRSDRYESAEADIFPLAPVEDGGTNGPALADQPEMSRAGHGTGEGGVQTRVRAHHAQAVGPDQADVATSRFAQNFPLQKHSTFADLAKSGADNDRALHSGIGALFHDARNRPCRCHDHRQLHAPGNRGDIGITGETQDRRVLRIHGVNRAGESAMHKIGDDRASHAAGSLGRSDDGDILGPEEHVQRRLAGLPLGRHTLMLCCRCVVPSRLWSCTT